MACSEAEYIVVQNIKNSLWSRAAQPTDKLVEI